MTVKIVVDSSAGLPHHLAREHDIAVAQLHVMTGEDRSSTAGMRAERTSRSFWTDPSKCLRVFKYFFSSFRTFGGSFSAVYRQLR